MKEIIAQLPKEDRENKNLQREIKNFSESLTAREKTLGKKFNSDKILKMWNVWKNERLSHSREKLN